MHKIYLKPRFCCYPTIVNVIFLGASLYRLISVEIEFQYIPEQLVTRPDQTTRLDQTKLPHHTTTESINVPQKDIYTYKHICNNIYLVIYRFKSRWTKKRGSLGTT